VTKLGLEISSRLINTFEHQEPAALLHCRGISRAFFSTGSQPLSVPKSVPAGQAGSLHLLPGLNQLPWCLQLHQ